jgi:hypothetical protein
MDIQHQQKPQQHQQPQQPQQSLKNIMLNLLDHQETETYVHPLMKLKHTLGSFHGVHLAQHYWSEPKMEQIIGRAIRLSIEEDDFDFDHDEDTESCDSCDSESLGSLRSDSDDDYDEDYDDMPPLIPVSDSDSDLLEIARNINVDDDDDDYDDMPALVPMIPTNYKEEKEELEEPVVNVPGDFTCSVCFEENIKLEAFTPCGHAFCYVCVKQIRNKKIPECPKCPICKKDIENTVKLFIDYK